MMLKVFSMIKGSENSLPGKTRGQMGLPNEAAASYNLKVLKERGVPGTVLDTNSLVTEGVTHLSGVSKAESEKLKL